MTGNDMRAIRKSIALTQHELAERLRVTRKTVVGWEASEGDLDEGVALQVHKIVGAIRLIEHTFWVDPTIRNTYAVVGRRILGMGGKINGATLLYGEFKRRDHAYRWCAALQVCNVDPHVTRKLHRERREEQAALAVQ
jgi:DNA-binding XRE family transcriptional regulator